MNRLQARTQRLYRSVLARQQGIDAVATGLRHGLERHAVDLMGKEHGTLVFGQCPKRVLERQHQAHAHENPLRISISVRDQVRQRPGRIIVIPCADDSR